MRSWRRRQQVPLERPAGATAPPARRRRFWERRTTAAPSERRHHLWQGRAPRAHSPHHWERQTESFMPGEGRHFLLDVVIPGGIAGTVGGALLLLIYMAGSAALGEGFLTAPKMLAGMFWRVTPVEQMGPLHVLIGLAVHFAASGGLATGFAMLLPRYNAAHIATVPLSLLYSALLYVFLLYFVVPYVIPPMRQVVIYPLWFIASMAWGGALALIQPLRRYRRSPESYARTVYAQREVHV